MSARGVADVLRHIFSAEIGQRVAFADAAHHHRAIQADKALAGVGEANMMPRERLLQHRLQQRWHLRRKGLGADRRRDIALLGQLPQQVGQAGAN